MTDTRVKIIGAGSIGNHLAQGCRSLGCAVTMTDIDAAALKRTRDDIYPSRYGAWDTDIRLAAPDELAGERFDLTVIGTPPDTHMRIAALELARQAPKILLIEKPLCTPDLDGCRELREQAAKQGTRVLVAYNHRLTEHTRLAAAWLEDIGVGEVTTLRALFREHWGGIFGAHPWLSGPADTYLGFTSRGGGAIGEHSHGINIWQYFAELTGHGRITTVSAELDEVEQDGAAYDRIAQLSVRTESGLLGTINQDVVTRPAQKWLRLEGQDGHLEWQVNADPGHDLVRLVRDDGRGREQRVAKTRPDDFRGEIEHVVKLLAEPTLPSPLDLESGLATMCVIAAALESARTGRRVSVDYRSLRGLDS
ncbi:MAG: Gfo/Idh/MocA family oxidoreductase [Gammaproteobacteria bacterium]|nr:Gfo/Idh/MocA family oxidoreductase [Gammaproteobacteria bacterium]